MTEARLALSEPLEKAGDGDFLRTVAEAVLQLLMEADVEGLIGAGQDATSCVWHPGARSALHSRVEASLCSNGGKRSDSLGAVKMPWHYQRTRRDSQFDLSTACTLGVHRQRQVSRCPSDGE